MRGSYLALAAAVLAAAALPASLEAQAQQEQAPDAVEADLVFEREVFSYPSFQRRNPFKPLLSEDAGPLFEDLRLLGIILSPDASQSVALLGVGDGAGAPERGYRSFRVRRGDVVGNTRIVEIQRTQVIVEVEEFGLTERHVMELQRPGQGGTR